MSKKDNRLKDRLAAITSAPSADLAAPLPKRRTERAYERQNVYRFARLILPDNSLIKCIVRDLSPRGARLAMEGQFALPKRVVFKMDQSGRTERATVLWQKESEVGLEFDR